MIDQQKIKKILEEYRPIDDEFLRVLLHENIPLTEKILSTITGINDLKIISEQTQYDMKRLVGSRSLCLDVLATDSDGRIFNMELQRADAGATAKRARYHSSSMDIEFLNAGDSFEKLPITYVIFITENDVRGKNRLIYRFDRIDSSTMELLDDGTHIIYVNGAYNNNDDLSDLAKLVHDFRCNKADDMYTELLAERTRYFKETKEGMSTMSKAMDDFLKEFAKDIREDALNEGLAQGKMEGLAQGKMEGKLEGKIEGKIETLTKLVKNGLITLEYAAADAGISIDEFRKLAMV